MPHIDSARIVIIGGGVIGLGVAYHLAKLGCDDVLLLERGQLTSGTSWHAAGIVGPLRASMNLTTLATYATRLFPQIEQETGQSTGYQRTGGLWLAQTEDRMVELRRIAAMGDMTGLHVDVIGPDDIARRAPYLETDDLAGALWVEEDGQANAVDICMAYAKGARAGGVRIVENTSVTQIARSNGAVTSVGLEDGSTIRCEIIVNCAGAWARHVGELAGVPVPLQAVEHMYIVTEPIAALPTPLPIIRDLDAHIYMKGDAGKLVLGGFEAFAKVWDESGPDGDRPFLEMPEDWQQFEPFMHAGLHRMPDLEHAGVAHFMNGPESFTPDSKQLMGESPYLKNFFVAAGFNSIGMMSSAGVGKAMAEWITAGEAPMDLWEVDIARFDRSAADRGWLASRMEEAVSDVFAMHWPFKQAASGRELKLGALHGEFKAAGAVFGAPTRWERPLWFSRAKSESEDRYSFGDQAWWVPAARESASIQNSVAMLELSPFGKFEIAGNDALEMLQRTCVSNLDVAVGTSVYTQILNRHGGIEADITATRTDDSSFLIISGAATRQRDRALLERHAHDFDLSIKDVTDEQTVIGIAGPRSRSLLSTCIPLSLNTDSFAFGQSRETSIAGCQVRVTRVSFTGELGYEIYIQNDDAPEVYAALIESGRPHELEFAGHLALDACRLEKGYRHWGHDIGPETTPLEAGLGFTVDFEKTGGFIGLAALKNQRKTGLEKRLLLFSLGDKHPLMLHDEPIYLGNQIAGHTTSGGRGFRTGLTLCMGYVHCEPQTTRNELLANQYEVKVAGVRYPLTNLPRPVYDPDSKRMRS